MFTEMMASGSGSGGDYNDVLPFIPWKKGLIYQLDAYPISVAATITVQGISKLRYVQIGQGAAYIDDDGVQHRFWNGVESANPQWAPTITGDNTYSYVQYNPTPMYLGRLHIGY